MTSLKQVIDNLKHHHPEKTENELAEDAGFIMGYNIGRQIAGQL